MDSSVDHWMGSGQPVLFCPGHCLETGKWLVYHIIIEQEREWEYKREFKYYFYTVPFFNGISNNEPLVAVFYSLLHQVHVFFWYKTAV